MEELSDKSKADTAEKEIPGKHSQVLIFKPAPSADFRNKNNCM